MLKRLADDGVVEYEAYHGARLTPEGERIALEVIRHHRLLELFLAEVLGMPWDRVHSEAEVLEHHISEELEELIAAKLGQPLRDPHGDPIPDRDLEITIEDSVALTDLEPGEGGVFARVSDSDASMLRYLAEREIQPGAALLVRSKEPFGGPVIVEIAGRTHPLGPQLAESMRVHGGRPVSKPDLSVGEEEVGLVEPAPGGSSVRPRRGRDVGSVESVLPGEAAVARAARASLEGRARGVRGSGRSSGRPSSPPSPTSTQATSPRTSPAGPSSGTCCSGSCWGRT